MKFPLIALVATVAFSASGLAGSLIIRPDSVVQTQGGASGSTTTYRPEFTIDNSGLSVAVNSGMALEAALAVTHEVKVSSQGAGPQNWQTSSSSTADYFAPDSNLLPPILVYNLGAVVHGLEGLLLWNNGIGQTTLNQAAIKAIEVRFSLDGSTWSTSALPFAVAAPPSAGVASPTTELPSNLIFGETFSAQYIEIKITDNYFGEAGSAANTGQRVGMGELRFYAVPEPSGVALLAFAAGAAALPIFRRRRSPR